MGRNVISGIKEGSLSSLTKGQKKAVIKMMSRIMEDSYRRGLQHGVSLHKREGLSEESVYKIRHEISLNWSPDTPDANGNFAPKFAWDKPENRLRMEYGLNIQHAGIDLYGGE